MEHSRDLACLISLVFGCYHADEFSSSLLMQYLLRRRFWRRRLRVRLLRSDRNDYSLLEGGSTSPNRKSHARSVWILPKLISFRSYFSHSSEGSGDLYTRIYEKLDIDSFPSLVIYTWSPEDANTWGWRTLRARKAFNGNKMETWSDFLTDIQGERAACWILIVVGNKCKLIFAWLSGSVPIEQESGIVQFWWIIWIPAKNKGFTALITRPSPKAGAES